MYIGGIYVFVCVCVYKRQYRLVRIGQATTKCGSMLRFVLGAFQGWALSTIKKIKRCRDTQTPSLFRIPRFLHCKYRRKATETEKCWP